VLQTKENPSAEKNTEGAEGQRSDRQKRYPTAEKIGPPLLGILVKEERQNATRSCLSTSWKGENSLRHFKWEPGRERDDVGQSWSQPLKTTAFMDERRWKSNHKASSPTALLRKQREHKSLTRQKGVLRGGMLMQESSPQRKKRQVIRIG